MKKVLKCLAASALIAAVITTASCKKGDNPTGSTGGDSVASNEYVKGDLNNGTVELSVHYTNSGYHFYTFLSRNFSSNRYRWRITCKR